MLRFSFDLPPLQILENFIKHPRVELSCKNFVFLCCCFLQQSTRAISWGWHSIMNGDFGKCIVYRLFIEKVAQPLDDEAGNGKMEWATGCNKNNFVYIFLRVKDGVFKNGGAVFSNMCLVFKKETIFIVLSVYSHCDEYTLSKHLEINADFRTTLEFPLTRYF